MELKIYDESLKQKVVRHSNKVEKAEGDIKRKRGDEYIQHASARSNARYKRRNGILRGMALLKLTTGDETFIEITNSNSHGKEKYSTSSQIMYTKRMAELQSTTQPNVLAFLHSPPLSPTTPITNVRSNLPSTSTITSPPTSEQNPSLPPTEIHPVVTENQLVTISTQDITDNIDNILEATTPSSKKRTRNTKNRNICQICKKSMLRTKNHG